MDKQSGKHPITLTVAIVFLAVFFAAAAPLPIGASSQVSNQIASHTTLDFIPFNPTKSTGLEQALVPTLASGADPSETLPSKALPPLYNDCLIPPVFPENQPQLPSQSPEPGPYDQSEYMIGDVAVTVIFPESNGAIDPNRENWSTSRMSTCISEITAGLTWWENQEPRANLHFSIHSLGTQPTGYEPINRPHTDEDLWVNEILTGLGFTSGDYLQKVRDLNNKERSLYKTDWAYAIFVVDSYNDRDGDGEFSDGWFGWAYPGGPFLVMTYDNDHWGISRMDCVTAHETGHIFWATDEYKDEPEYSGYLNVQDNDFADCIMNDDCAWNVCPATRGQVGWKDSDGDGILDPVDTFPDTALEPYPSNPTNNTRLVCRGTVQDVPLTNNNPNPYPYYPFPPRNGVSINTITAVQYRIDYGAWQNATSEDGAFDEVSERFSFITPSLSPGNHVVETRAQNSVGNWETSYSMSGITIITTVPVTINTSGLSSLHPATIHYVEGGIAKTATTYGTWSGEVDYLSTLSIDDTHTVSSTERYHTTDITSRVIAARAIYSVTYYHQFKPTITATGLNSAHPATLTLKHGGIVNNPTTHASWSDWVDIDSELSISNTISVSSTERYHTLDTTSWAVNGAITPALDYTHQFFVTIVTSGLDPSHPATITFIQYGGRNSLTTFKSWGDWADAGSTLTIDRSVEGGWTGGWSTNDMTSWVVNSAISATVSYGRSHTGIYILVGALGGATVVGIGIFLIIRRNKNAQRGVKQSDFTQRTGVYAQEAKKTYEPPHATTEPTERRCPNCGRGLYFDRKTLLWQCDEGHAFYEPPPRNRSE